MIEEYLENLFRQIYGPDLELVSWKIVSFPSSLIRSIMVECQLANCVISDGLSLQRAMNDCLRRNALPIGIIQ